MVMDTTFIINTGSSSKKYAIYKEESVIFTACFERKEDQHSLTTSDITGNREKVDITESEYAYALAHIVKIALQQNIIESPESVKAVGIRIVAPGSFFQDIQDRYRPSHELLHSARTQVR